MYRRIYISYSSMNIDLIEHDKPRKLEILLSLSRNKYRINRTWIKASFWVASIFGDQQYT